MVSPIGFQWFKISSLLFFYNRLIFSFLSRDFEWSPHVPGVGTYTPLRFNLHFALSELFCF